MKKQILLVLLISISLSVSSIDGILGPNSEIDDNLVTDQLDRFEIIPNEPDEFILTPTIPINVVFLGFDKTNIDINQIDQDLTKWYVPVVWNDDVYPLEANYTFNMNYYFSSDASNLDSDFISYLNSNGVLGAAPPQELLDKYDASATQANYYDAGAAFDWLSNNINNYFPGVNQTYTIYLIDTYSKSYISDYYFYTLGFNDWDTGMNTDEDLTISWGGTHRGFFLDLSAGPIFYQDQSTEALDEGVSATTIPPIWTYSLPGDAFNLNDNLTEYIQETIELTFTPSYIYESEMRLDFDIKIILFDDASQSYAQNIDRDRIRTSFENLSPLADVSVSYLATSLLEYPELVDLINNNNYDQNGDTVVQTDLIRDWLKQNQEIFSVTDQDLPVFIFSWDNTNLWMNGQFVLGRAWSDGNSNPEMVIMGYAPANYPNDGFTTTIIHEVGHLSGLRHPHDGFSYEYGEDYGNPFFVDWLRDFTSTPMTYATSDITFSVFDRDQVNRGYTIDALNKTSWNVLEANNTLIENNFNDPSYYIQDSSEISELEDLLGWINENTSLAKSNFENMDYINAFYYGYYAYYASLSYLDLANQLDLIAGPETTTIYSTETLNSTVTTILESTTTQINTETTPSTITVTEGSVVFPFSLFLIMVVMIPIVKRFRR